MAQQKLPWQQELIVKLREFKLLKLKDEANRLSTSAV